MRTALALAFALAAVTAHAQGLSTPPVDTRQFVTPDQLNAAAASNLAAMQAAIPAGNVVPPPVNSTGNVGTSSAFARADHTHLSSVYKAITTTTDATGLLTWTYPVGFFTAAPVIQLTVEATSGQPMTALVTSNTATGGTAQVLRAQMLPANIVTLTGLVNFNVYAGAVPVGTRVHVYAAKAS